MDDNALISSSLPMVSTGFLPAETLLESLIHISNEVTSSSMFENLPSLQRKNTSAMIRKVQLLSSLFEEVRESEKPLPPSSILCLTELFYVIRGAHILIESCKEKSLLWNLLQTETVSNQFHTLLREMAKALDILPLSLLNLTADLREQVELLHKQAKRAQLLVDRKEIHIRDEILRLMVVVTNGERHGKNKGVFDSVRDRDVFFSIGLRSPLDFEEEISKLKAESAKQAGTGGLVAVSKINNLISLVTQSKDTIFSHDNTIWKNHEDAKKKRRKIPTMMVIDKEQSFPDSVTPDEFRCPISLELMKDPVIIASGHTYDRNSIAQWINSGHHTCPKSGQRLIHMALIPNYSLKSLIHQWCQENNITPLLPESTSSSSHLIIKGTSFKRKSHDNSPSIDHISASKASIDAVKMTAEFLVGKLATGSHDVQTQAAYELRLLAKTGMDHRRIIAEAGAIPFLVALMTSKNPMIQENAVTALLNLSIYDNNKKLIMAAGALDNIVEALRLGKTMEAKENAAATIFSLSIIDEYKVIIGNHPKAISALIGLLTEGTTAGKRDAATALLNLSVYNANRAKVVHCGAVPLLVNLLTDDRAGITDDALAVLALVMGCNEGLVEIRKSRNLVPVLIDLLRFGSFKGKENAITLLLGLCKDGGEEVARRLLMNPRSIPSLQALATDGSLKARRKADALLRILNRCCSQIANHVG